MVEHALIKGRIAAWAFICLVSAAFFFATAQFLPEYYDWKEPHFINPVKESNQNLELRNDNMGEGHFGASRANGRRQHLGIDIKSGMGNTVLATKSGRVKLARLKGGYGNLVIISHLRGFESRYAHLSGPRDFPAVVVDAFEAAHER